MKLQLTIDHGKDFEVLDMVEKLSPVVDVVEIGYPIMVTFGLTLVQEIRRRNPDVTLYADIKLFHGGTGIIGRCFDMGADVVSVLSAAPDPVISKAVAQAHERGGKIACNLTCPPSRVGERTAQVDELGVDYVIAVSGYIPAYDYDLESHRGPRLFEPKVRPLDIAATAKRNLRQAKLGVSTGINESNIRDVVALGPELVLVGRGILDAPDRTEAAARLKRYMPFEG